MLTFTYSMLTLSTSVHVLKGLSPEGLRTYHPTNKHETLQVEKKCKEVFWFTHKTEVYLYISSVECLAVSTRNCLFIKPKTAIILASLSCSSTDCLRPCFH